MTEQVTGHGQASPSVVGSMATVSQGMGAALWQYTVPFPSTSDDTAISSIIEEMLTESFATFDQIGVTWGGREVGSNVDGPSLLIPPGWMWWATLNVRIDTEGSIVANDVFRWDVGTEDGPQSTVFASCAGVEENGYLSISCMGASSTDGSLIGYDDITTQLGTEFKVPFARLYIQGIQGQAENLGPPPPSS